MNGELLYVLRDALARRYIKLSEVAMEIRQMKLEIIEAGGYVDVDLYPATMVLNLEK